MKKKTYYCDRCGKPKTPSTVNIKFPGKLVEDVTWIRLCSRTGYELDADLCPECLMSFKDWFDNGHPLESSSEPK